MGAEQRWGAGVGGTSQGLVRAAQMGRDHQRGCAEGAQSFAGAPFSWQGGVGFGQVGCVGDAGWSGGPIGSTVSAVGFGQTGGNHLRGGSLEGARRLGGVSNSSLSVAGVGPMGGVLEMGGHEDQMVDVEESSDGELEAINEAPSTAAQPAANPLDSVTDTVSFPHF